MEYCSFGLMGENRTEYNQPCFGDHRGMIICSVKVIRQKSIQDVCAKYCDDPYKLGKCFSHYSNTPILHIPGYQELSANLMSLFYCS